MTGGGWEQVGVVAMKIKCEKTDWWGICRSVVVIRKW